MPGKREEGSAYGCKRSACNPFGYCPPVGRVESDGVEGPSGSPGYLARDGGRGEADRAGARVPPEPHCPFPLLEEKQHDRRGRAEDRTLLLLLRHRGLIQRR